MKRWTRGLLVGGFGALLTLNPLPAGAQPSPCPTCDELNAKPGAGGPVGFGNQWTLLCPENLLDNDWQVGGKKGTYTARIVGSRTSGVVASETVQMEHDGTGVTVGHISVHYAGFGTSYRWTITNPDGVTVIDRSEVFVCECPQTPPTSPPTTVPPPATSVPASPPSSSPAPPPGTPPASTVPGTPVPPPSAVPGTPPTLPATGRTNPLHPLESPLPLAAAALVAFGSLAIAAERKARR